MKAIAVWWQLGKLDAKKPEVRAAAIERLAALGDSRAVGPLSKLLHDEQRTIRAAAAQALGAIGDATAVGPLVATLLDEKYWDVRHEVVESLRKIGDPTAVNELLLVLDGDDEDIGLQQFCAWALKEFGWEHLAPDQRASVAILRDDWDAVSRIGAAAIKPLIDAMQTGTHRVRRHSAEALLRIESPRATEALVKLLEHQDSDVRHTAADTLDRLAWARLEPADLARVALELRKWTALKSLGAAAVGPLLELMRTADPDLRNQAIETLGNIGGARAATALVQAARQSDVAVRRAALKALGLAGDSAGTQELVAALDDPDYAAREAAAGSLVLLGWSSPNEGDRARVAVYTRNWADVAQLGPAAVPPLTAALSYPPARALAADMLRKLGGAAIEPLTKVFDDPSPAVRACAADTLGAIADKRAVSALEHLLAEDQDEAVRHAAFAALERVGWQPRDDAHRAEVAIALDDWPQVVTLGAPAVPLLIKLIDGTRGEKALTALEQILSSDAATEVPMAQIRALAGLVSAPTRAGGIQAGNADGGKKLQTAVARRRVSQLARTELTRRNVPA